MKQTLQTKSLFTAILLFVFSLGALAQTPPTLVPNIAITNAQCRGNGALTLSVPGNTGTVSYNVYAGQNASGTPINGSPFTGNPVTVSSLEAGFYTVVASQSVLGTVITSLPITVEIVPTSNPALSGTTIQGARCGGDGKVTVNTLSGVIKRYTLYDATQTTVLAGPREATEANANIFDNLAIGNYRIVVEDICGVLQFLDVSVFQESTRINVDPVTWPRLDPLGNPLWYLASCNTISVQHTIYTTGTQTIWYPLTLTYTVTPPGGGTPIVVTETIEEGDIPPNQRNNFVWNTTPIPFYENQEYSYTLVITDICGNPFGQTNNTLFEKFEFLAEPNYGHCDETVIITPHNYAAPITVEFTQSPVGFTGTEISHNPEHDTFVDPAAVPIVYKNHMPDGQYTVKLTDCGHTASVPFMMQTPNQDVSFTGTIDCITGDGTITGTWFTRPDTDFDYVHVITDSIAVPNTFTDISSGINPMKKSEFNYTSSDFVLGETYLIETLNECGDTLRKPVLMRLGGGSLRTEYVSRPGCDVGKGSINVFPLPRFGQPGFLPITGVTIISGPPEWEAANPVRPVNADANVVASNGEFYMNNLPEGDYVIDIYGGCTPSRVTVTIIGYHDTVRTGSIEPGCGTFNVLVDVQGNNNVASASPNYYLQKEITPGVWGHPDTNVVYTYGALPVGVFPEAPVQPANANSIRLHPPSINQAGVYQIGQTTYTGGALGTFRLIQVYSIFANGDILGERCITILDTKVQTGQPVINGVYSFPCTAGNGEAIVDAVTVGTPDEVTYSIDNNVTTQQSNVFTGLAENTPYTFTVNDKCGTTNLVAEIQPAAELAITRSGLCENQLVQLTVPEYSFLTYQWYNTAAPTVILSTNGLLEFREYSSADNAGTYEVRVTYPGNAQSCLNQTLQITLGSNTLPNAGADSLNNTACTNASAQAIDLNTLLTAPFDQGGIWTDVATGLEVPNGSFNIAAVTTDAVINFAYTITDSCNNTDVATVRFTISETPVVPVITGPSLVCEGARVQLTAASTTPGVTYAWTTPNGPVVGDSIDVPATLAAAGVYTVTATSASGSCSSTAIQTVTVTALVTAGDDVSVPATCSDANANVLNLDQFITASATTDGSFTLGTQDDPGLAFDSIAGTFDTANLVGTFEFIYSVTACGITDTAVITFTINPTPAAPVATVDAAVVCENGTIQLNTPAYAGTGTVTYIWSGPNGFTSALQNPTVPATLAAAGDYSLTLIVDNCTSDPSAPVNVAVTPLPQFSLTGNTVICPTQFTTLSVTPGNFGVGDTNITYQWTLDGNIVSNTNTARVDQLGEYLVTVSNGSCTSPAQPITVTADPDPFTVTLQGDCVNEHFILSITNLTEIGTTQSIVWTGPGTSDATNSPTLDLVGKDPGTYEVVVTNADGCFKQASIIVETTECTIPKGISPNGDNFNNEFDLTNLKVQNLQIFNRYGLQVYEKNNYTKEWYGQSDKGDLPTGTYFYVAKMADRQVTGWVYIQREQ
jgi:gliding motility-associated-like protein